jgi:hypothetical protein
VAQFQKLIDGRHAWSNFLPAMYNSTLEGVALSGLSIDDKLQIKLDGIAHSHAAYTPYGMVARQIVTYRDTTYQPPAGSPATTPTKSTTQTAVLNKLFTNVIVSSLSEVKKTDISGNVTDYYAKFSMTFTLNPNVLKVTPIVAPASKATGSSQ